MRGTGVTDALVDLLPPWLTPVLEVLTALGDPALLVVVAAALYVFAPRVGFGRRQAAVVLAGTLLAVAAVGFLKSGFRLARPGDTIGRIAADGFGFPSGHTATAAGFYVGLAAVTGWRERRERALAAGALVAVVAFTRLALGVHFLPDVLVGGAVGALCAWAAFASGRADALVAPFAAATLLALVTALAWGASRDAAMTTGLAGGLTLAWVALDRHDPGEQTGRPGLFVPGAAALLVAVAVGVYLVGEPPLLVVAGGGLGGVGVVALPAVQNFSR